MDPKHLFADERLRGYCVYCGGEPSTADHVPARVFLDEPHPETPRVVDACAKLIVAALPQKAADLKQTDLRTQ